jgi:multisubunit Na+/H+ antiporter MnhB subunit
VKRLVVVDVSVRTIFHVVLLGSVFLLVVGHNRPGGGFVGGLLAGSAIAMRYVDGGIDDVRSLTRFRPWTILGTGLLLAGGLALAPVMLGDPVLDTAYASVDLPVLGEVSLTSTLLFDVGVYLVVVGLVLMVFEAFGDEIEPIEASPELLDEPDPLDDELTPATVELEEEAAAVTEAVDGATE